MAKERIEITVCDDCGDGTEAEGDPIKAVIDGVTFEYDLCKEHKAEWKRYGRKISGARRSKNHPTTAPRRQRRANPDPRKVRKWAEANGIDVNPKGRVKAEVIDLYRDRRAA